MRPAFLSSSALVALLVSAVASAGVSRPPCVGDCDDDGRISIAELVRGVNIALGGSLAPCPSFDRSGNGSVSIDELVAAVSGALSGCEPAVAVGAAPAAGSVAVVNALDALPELVTALASGMAFGGDVAGAELGEWPEGVGTVAGACPLGGSSDRSCSGAIITLTTITLSSCAVAAGDGSLTAHGTVSLRGTGICPAVVPSSAGVSIDSVLRDAGGSIVRTATARLAGAIDAQLGGDCFVNGARLRLTGTLETEDPRGEGISIAFDDTTVDLAVVQFGASCVPVLTTMTLNGPALITDRASRVPLRVSFENFVLSREVRDGGTVARMSGRLTAACFDGPVDVQTRTPLDFDAGDPCPRAGALALAALGGTIGVVHRADGGVDIDADDDGMPERSFASCRDIVASMCPLPPVAVVFRTIADTNTIMPAADEPFARFFAVALESGTVVFSGAGHPSPDAPSFPRRGIYMDRGGLRRVADTDTHVPGEGAQTRFTAFSSLAVSNGSVAFDGVYFANTRDGLYLADAQSPDELQIVANRDTEEPGDPLRHFERFSGVAFDGLRIAFAGRTVGPVERTGIYMFPLFDDPQIVADERTMVSGSSDPFVEFPIADQPVGLEDLGLTANVVFQALDADSRLGVYASFGFGGLQRIADRDTPVPGASGNFFSTSSASISHGVVAFVGSGSNGGGIYRAGAGPLEVVANRDTAIPGGSGTFTAFEYTSNDRGAIAFVGRQRPGGADGVYVARGDTVQKVVATGDLLDGKRVTALRIGTESLSFDEVAFIAEFDDESSGVYVGRFPLQP